MADTEHVEQDFSVERIDDLIYATPGGQPLLLDLYLPQGSAQRWPVILWLHGGGWRLGDRRLAPDLSRFFAQRGFAMASIDYRLSQQALFPAQVHDVKAAIRWLRANADRYSLDRERIGLWGSSAGGHLAVLAALTASTDLLKDDQSSHLEQPEYVLAVVDGYGPTDFLLMDEQRDANGKPSDDPESIQLPPGKKSTDADSAESLLIGAPLLERPDLVKQANPLTYVHADAPPMLILHGLSDTAVPAQQSELLYNALVATGNAVTLGLITGLGHGFLNRNNFDQGEPHPVQIRTARRGISEQVPDGAPPITFQTIETFFREHLGLAAN